jgi:hypothetical protein
MSPRELLGWVEFFEEREAAEREAASAPAPRPRKRGQSGNLMEMTGDQVLAAFGVGGA